MVAAYNNVTNRDKTMFMVSEATLRDGLNIHSVISNRRSKKPCLSQSTLWLRSICNYPFFPMVSTSLDYIFQNKNYFSFFFYWFSPWFFNHSSDHGKKKKNHSRKQHSTDYDSWRNTMTSWPHQVEAVRFVLRNGAKSMCFYYCVGWSNMPEGITVGPVTSSVWEPSLL